MKDSGREREVLLSAFCGVQRDLNYECRELLFRWAALQDCEKFRDLMLPRKLYRERERREGETCHRI